MHKTESEALASPQPSGWQQLLDALLAQWRTTLPFAADRGMEVDWAQAGLRIGDAAKGYCRGKCCLVGIKK